MDKRRTTAAWVAVGALGVSTLALGAHVVIGNPSQPAESPAVHIQAPKTVKQNQEVTKQELSTEASDDETPNREPEKPEKTTDSSAVPVAPAPAQKAVGSANTALTPVSASSP